MKQRIKNKIFKNRRRLKYTLGQIFTASRGTVLWVQPRNGFQYRLHYFNGKVEKEKIKMNPIYDTNSIMASACGKLINCNKIIYLGV